ncbi:hypothetical protein D3C72_1793530 [compost metagenome]
MQGLEPGQFGSAQDVVGQEDLGDVGIGEDLGLAQLLHGDAHGTQVHGPLGEAGQLVGLDVRAQLETMTIRIVLRPPEVGLDAVDIDQNGGCIEFQNAGHFPLRTSSTKRRLPAVRPASTGSTVPVMPDAASEL